MIWPGRDAVHCLLSSRGSGIEGKQLELQALLREKINLCSHALRLGLHCGHGCRGFLDFCAGIAALLVPLCGFPFRLNDHACQLILLAICCIDVHVLPFLRKRC